MVQTIAVGTDGSETAQRAVDFAMDMAQSFGAKIVFASAYRPVSETKLTRERDAAPADVQWSVNPNQEVEATLRQAEDLARERGLSFASEARTGDPADVLVEIAADAGADVLVVGNKGMSRRVLGSVPNSVSHKAPCSVLIVKTDE
jgi:nucleotide-binding universal stress UspA family protein